MSLHHFPNRNSLNSFTFLRSFWNQLPVVSVLTPTSTCAQCSNHHFLLFKLDTNFYLHSVLEPPLPIVQTRHQLLPALSTRTTSSYCSPFQFLISSHFTHPGKLWYNTTIVVITVESGTAQLISATTLNSVCLSGIKPNKGALRQEKTLQV